MDRPADALEDRFVRFQRHGDPEALAAVFRQTAPKLLELAVQLTDDPAQAEDALQSTFVTAMEKADSFESGRPLLPWLCGILQLHCKSLRARARRTADPMRLPLRGVKDPLDAAMAGEIDRGLREAIDALPAPYRTVVVLRLLHGMEPAAIAHALGEAPGTVRVRLHRGLGMVRARLPRSIAAPALAWPLLQIAPERGVDVVGREVLRHARHLLPATKTAATLGVAVLAMKKTVFAVVAATLVVLTGVALSQLGSNDARPAPNLSAESGLTEAKAAVGIERASTTQVAPADHESTQRSAVESTSVAATRRGIRVVARRPGAGGIAAHVGITVLPHDGRHPDLHTLRRFTDHDGVAMFDDLPQGRYGVYVDRAAREWKPEEPAKVEAENQGVSLELARLLSRAEPIEIQGGSFTVSTLSPLIRARAELPVLTDLSAVLTTGMVLDDASGGIQVDGQQIQIEDSAVVIPDFKLSSALPDRSPTVVVEVTEGYALAQVEVEGGVTVSGKVVDATDQPVAGAEIWVVRDGGRTAFPVATSKADGAFQIDDVDPGTNLFARKRDFVASGPVEASAGQTVELKLGPRAAGIEGRVLDANGQPIADARVRIGDPEQDDTRRVQVPTDRDGHFASTAPALGTVPVLVLAPGFQPWLGTVEVGREETAHLDITLAAGGILSGIVHGPDGTPREGVLVVAKADGQPDTDVRSGPGGAYRLECVAPGVVTLTVEQEGDHRGAEVRTTAIAGSELQVDVDLRPYGHIRGHLTDASGAALRGATIYAMPAADSKTPPAHARVNGDGAFEIRTLPGSSYAIEVVPERNNVHTFQMVQQGKGNGTLSLAFVFGGESDDATPKPGLRRIPCPWLGMVPADRDGLDIQLPLDLVPSARIKGRVLKPDATPLGGSLRVHVDGGSRDIGLDENGAFDVGPLVPGAFRFEIVPNDQAFASFDLPVTNLAPSQVMDLGAVYASTSGERKDGR